MPKNTKKEWQYVIFCDHGKRGEKTVICRSYSKKTAENSWKKFYKNFSQGNWRCWQENKKGKIIRDTSEAVVT